MTTLYLTSDLHLHRELCYVITLYLISDLHLYRELCYVTTLYLTSDLHLHRELCYGDIELHSEDVDAPKHSSLARKHTTRRHSRLAVDSSLVTTNGHGTSTRGL